MQLPIKIEYGINRISMFYYLGRSDHFFMITKKNKNII